jgi:Na+/H+ antiporter NhaD/arsenite permease-like protein
MDTALMLIILVVFSLLVVLVVWFLAEMAMLPGKIARKRNHPQAEAISVAGWLGLLVTMGLVWVLAVIWAHMRPDSQPGTQV